MDLVLYLVVGIGMALLGEAMHAARVASGRKLGETREELDRTEDRFRHYLNVIGMSISSPTKGLVEVNGEIPRIVGYQRSELLPDGLGYLTHPDDLAGDVRNFERVMAGEIDDYSMDKRRIRKNGQVIDSTISMSFAKRTGR